MVTVIITPLGTIIGLASGQIRDQSYFTVILVTNHAALHFELHQHEKGTKPFRFFLSWLGIPSFNDAFVRAWEPTVTGSPLYILHHKLKYAKTVIRGWAAMDGNPTPKSKLAAEELQRLATVLAQNPYDITLVN